MDILGIDVAKRTFDVALLRDKLKHRQFTNNLDGFNDLTGWLVRQGVTKVHVCLEATGVYSEPLAIFLHEAGHTVSMVNPARIKAYGQAELQRNKTDRADATLIARFCSQHKPEPWAPPPTEVRQLKALVRHLDNLIENRTQLTNRLADCPNVEPVIKSLQKLIETVKAQISQTKKQIHNHLNNHPDLKRASELLTTIPGIGEQTAAVLLGEIEHLRTYSQARQAAAYAGLSPRNNQSGNIKYPAHLSKTGNKHVRKALYMPAITAIRHNPIIRAFADKLSKAGKPMAVVIGAAMRKLLHLAFGVLKTNKAFCENHSQSA